MEKPWISGIPSRKKARYQPIANCTYWPVLGSYNNLNIIELTTKSIPFEAFHDIHTVVLDRISENSVSLVQPGMCGAINTANNKTNEFYVIQFISETGYKIIQQFMYKLFLLVNYLSRHNIFDPYKEKNQLVLETKINAKYHHSPNTQNTSSTS